MNAGFLYLLLALYTGSFLAYVLKRYTTECNTDITFISIMAGILGGFFCGLIGTTVLEGRANKTILQKYTIEQKDNELVIYENGQYKKLAEYVGSTSAKNADPQRSILVKYDSIGTLGVLYHNFPTKYELQTKD